MELIEPTPAAECIWCGGGEVNAEDVIPKWAGRVLRKLVPAHERAMQELTPGRSVSIEDLDKRVPLHARRIGLPCGPRRFVVCRACNGGWMSAIEKRAKTVMEPLILGDELPTSGMPREIGELIALWMAKTVAVMDSSSDRPAVLTQSFRRSLRERQAAVNGTRVWIGRYDPSYGELTTRHLLKLKVGPKPSQDLLLATLALGHLLLQMTMTVTSTGDLAPPQRRAQPNEYLMEIWPTPIGEWPPRKKVDQYSIADMAYPIAARPVPATTRRVVRPSSGARERIPR